jgi:hypothetical protein
VARMGEKRKVYSLLVGRPEGKRPLGRPRRRWIDNIVIDIFEILYPQKLTLNFVDKWRSLSRYSSLADYGPRSLFFFF